MKYPDLVYRKIKRTARKIAELSASEDDVDEWWGMDTDIGNLPLDIQKELSKFYDWAIEHHELHKKKQPHNH